MVFCMGLIQAQNFTYAKNYFSHFLEYQDVLETRRWHPLFPFSALDCSYAIVSLTKDAKPEPPSKWLDSEEWLPTPMLESDKSPYDIIGSCGHYWSPETNIRIQKALQQPGSYYFPMTIEVLFIYSAKDQIAAKIRYGD